MIAAMTPKIASESDNAIKIDNLIREIAINSQSFVIDGRNTGSTIFPDAKYKFYLTTNPYTRSIRRLADLRKSGEFIEFSKVYKDLKKSKKDKERLNSPLIIPENALVIDISDMSKKEVLLEIFKNISELNKFYKEVMSELKEKIFKIH